MYEIKTMLDNAYKAMDAFMTVFAKGIDDCKFLYIHNDIEYEIVAVLKFDTIQRNYQHLIQLQTIDQMKPKQAAMLIQ